MRSPSRSGHRFALVFLLAATCDDGASGTFGSGAAEARRYCEEFQTAFATRSTECQGGRPETVKRLYDSIASTACADISASVAAGSTTFDATAATACLRLLSEATCDTVAPVSSPCEQAFTPLVGAGGVCRTHFDCAEGYCLSDPGSCGGRCEDRPGLGESCDNPVRVCARGTYCRGSVCASDRRQTETAGPCSTQIDCPGGILDRLFYCAAGTCQPTRTRGACQDSVECRLKYYCHPTTRDCQPRRAAGEGPCSVVVSSCESNSYCLASDAGPSVCVEEASPDGTRCSNFTEAFAPCSGWCEPTGGTSSEGICRPKKAVGQPCASDGQCVTNRCGRQSGVCLAACGP